MAIETPRPISDFLGAMAEALQHAKEAAEENEKLKAELEPTKKEAERYRKNFHDICLISTQKEALLKGFRGRFGDVISLCRSCDGLGVVFDEKRLTTDKACLLCNGTGVIHSHGNEKQA